MNHCKNPALLFTCLLIYVFCISCGNNSSADKVIVTSPEKMNATTSERIQKALELALKNNGKISDSDRLGFTNLVDEFYKTNEYNTAWSDKEKWQPLTDSLIAFIEHAETYGLFPKDYHYPLLKKLKTKIDTDSLTRIDALQWTRADLLLTDAFMHLAKDLKNGRLLSDSVSNAKLKSDAKYYTASLTALFKQHSFTGAIGQFEPKHKAYRELQLVVKDFLDSMDRKVYTYVSYPFKANDVKDSLAFIKQFQKRLAESQCIDVTSSLPDSTELNTAVKKYQKLKGIKQDGKISASLVKLLNVNDVERFKRIAITLDRYKELPDSMPEKFIWVNLPGYYLQVWDHDTMAFDSKVICGKPATRTPILTSKITDMVTYPTWTVPTSIIAKQYLPKLKNNPNYLSRIGLRLVGSKGETIDPNSVKWSKYSKGIPYKVMQGSGDDNALGIIKFNFDNPYAVYLHDTNQRYLFKNAARALSHGCVRVQEWEKLAFYLVRNDSLNLKEGDSLRYTTDSIKTLLTNKERRRIGVKNEVPLFIRYFTCEAKAGKIKFYDDIYGEDTKLREKYFANK